MLGSWSTKALTVRDAAMRLRAGETTLFEAPRHP